MSGHSKWHSIKHKKAATDAARGKIFTKHARIIAISARSGGDPEMNPSLRLAIDNAKKENMPNSNIERAIKKGTGENKGSAIIEELTYEGYGPGGVAIIVKVLTDNKNRSVANIKHLFVKNGGKLGESGSVLWMFSLQGFIVITAKKKEMEETELILIDAGINDIEYENDFAYIYTPMEKLFEIKKVIENEKLEIEQANIKYIPKNTVKIEDEKMAKQILRLVSQLEEDDDVESVSANFDISEKLNIS